MKVLSQLAVTFLLLTLAYAQSTTPSKESPMTNHAAGPFDVKVTPEEDKSAEPTLGRMTLDKHYHGDLEAAGKGTMLTASTEVKGSAAYVAIEHVAGTLKGRSGTFALQHAGTMDKGAAQLNITVVPDSGTGQLKGLSGKMNIIIAPGGKHSYELEYTLPESN